MLFYEGYPSAILEIIGMEESADLVEVCGHPDYLISRSGKVILKETGRELRKNVNKNGVITVSLRSSGTTEKYNTFSIFKLLAMTFIDSAKACLRKYVCVPKDGDQSNTCTDNTRIITQQEFQKAIVTAKREEALVRFSWTDGDEPVESPKQGFYWIPFVRFPVAVSRTGQFYNFMKSREVKLNINHKGYYTVSLWDEDLGKYVSHSVHRVVARVFIAVPSKYHDFDISELQVNHKDGMKENNEVSNLEWCLNHENMEHARKMGLFSNEHPVLAKDIRTGKITRYRSVSECAREFDIENGSLTVHLSSLRSAGRITFNWHVFKYDDCSPWPRTLMECHDQDGYKWVCNVVVKDVNTDNYLIFSNYRHACRALGLTLYKVRNWIKYYGYDKPYKGYLFSTLTDEMEVD